MAFTEDLSLFFDGLDAVNATFNGQTVKVYVIAGMDDAPLIGRNQGAGDSPSVVLPSTSVPARPEGLSLVIQQGPAAGNWRVGYAQPDGTGLHTIVLKPA